MIASILNRTLPELLDLPDSPADLYLAMPETVVSAGLIPSAELERLRAIAVYPDDPIEVLQAISLGYLAKADPSDLTLSLLICRLCRYAGVDKLPPLSLNKVPDTDIYGDLQLHLFESLPLPGFRYPELLSSGDAAQVTWGQVARLTERDVVSSFGLSAKGLKAVSYLWELKNLAQSIHQAALAGVTAEVYRDFHRLADTCVKLATRKQPDPTHCERNYRLMKARLPFTNHPPATLEELGSTVQLTRERVRQVEAGVKATLKSAAFSGHLVYLRLLVDHLLCCSGGVRRADDLTSSLGAILGWSQPPSTTAVCSFLEVTLDHAVVRGETVRVISKAGKCPLCPEPGRSLVRAVSEHPDGVVTFDEGTRAVREQCHRLGCPEAGRISDFSALVELAAEGAEEVRAGREGFYSQDAWFAREGRLCTFCERVLLQSGKAHHFKELHRQLSPMLPEERRPSEHKLYNMLATSPVLLLWGAGTFIHRAHVSIPTALIAKIRRDLQARLTQESLPFLCVNGSVFEKYRKRLCAKGVPSSLALYSCLREMGSKTLSFAEYPYVLCKARAGARLKITQAIEQFLLESKGAVSREEIDAFACGTLGINKDQCSTFLTKVPNMLRVQRGLYLHLSVLGITKHDLEPIVGRLSDAVLTAKSLYLEHAATCRKLGITTPMLLSSLIQHFHPGQFTFSSYSNGQIGNYPPRSRARKRYRARKPAEAEPPKPPKAPRPPKPTKAPRPTKEDSLLAQMMDYIEGKKGPCLTKELIDAFRPRMKSEEYCYALLWDKKRVLWCTTDSVITRRALPWNHEKQAAIEKLADAHLRERAREGAVFGLCSEIYREMGKHLPDLGKLDWSPVLLHGLLGSGNRYLALGRSRDLFWSASNAYGIATLDDLSLHILKTHYGGAAPVAEFMRALRRMGIMRRKRTTFVNGKDPRVVLDGEWLRIVS